MPKGNGAIWSRLNWRALPHPDLNDVSDAVGIELAVDRPMASFTPWHRVFVAARRRPVGNRPSVVLAVNPTAQMLELIMTVTGLLSTKLSAKFAAALLAIAGAGTTMGGNIGIAAHYATIANATAPSSAAQLNCEAPVSDRSSEKRV